MKHWIVAALFCTGIAQVGTGCILVDDDDDNDGRFEPSVESNKFLVSWQLLTGDSNAQVACPSQVAEVQVVMLDSSDNQTVDSFDCADDNVLTEELPDGVYDIYINLMDENQELFAQSSVIEDERLDPDNPGPVELVFSFSIDRGSFNLGWELKDGENAASCAALNLDKIAVTSTLAGENGEVFDDTFDCVEGQGDTKGLPLGVYTLSAQLSADDANVGEAVSLEGEIEFGNHYNILEAFVFDLSTPAPAGQ